MPRDSVASSIIQLRVNLDCLATRLSYMTKVTGRNGVRGGARRHPDDRARGRRHTASRVEDLASRISHLKFVNHRRFRAFDDGCTHASVVVVVVRACRDRRIAEGRILSN